MQEAADSSVVVTASIHPFVLHENGITPMSFLRQFAKPISWAFVGLMLFVSMASTGCSSDYDERVKQRGDALRYAEGESQYDN